MRDDKDDISNDKSKSSNKVPKLKQSVKIAKKERPQIEIKKKQSGKELE